MPRFPQLGCPVCPLGDGLVDVRGNVANRIIVAAVPRIRKGPGLARDNEKAFATLPDRVDVSDRGTSCGEMPAPKIADLCRWLPWGGVERGLDRLFEMCGPGGVVLAFQVRLRQGLSEGLRRGFKVNDDPSLLPL